MHPELLSVTIKDFLSESNLILPWYSHFLGKSSPSNLYVLKESKNFKEKERTFFISRNIKIHKRIKNILSGNEFKLSLK